MSFLNLLGIGDLTGGSDSYMPSLGSDYTPVTTGSSSNMINFAKSASDGGGYGGDGNGLLKIGLIAGAIILGLLVLKKKK